MIEHTEKRNNILTPVSKEEFEGFKDYIPTN